MDPGRLESALHSTTGRQDAGKEILSLTCDLCAFATGVVAPDNERLFARLRQDLPLRIHRFPSGSTFNGWVVPDLWRVKEATITREGKKVFDGGAHTLAVAAYSKSFHGELEFDGLRRHVVTNPELPEAYMYHCMWQYRPWDADWAFCIPYEIYKTFGAGRYRVDLETSYDPDEMLVGEYEHTGASRETVVLNAHTCHPHMANDDFAGVAVLIRLFQWLQAQKTYYTYRLVLGPEHVGTVFYLRNRRAEELHRLVGGAFAEMPGTSGPVKLASSFLGGQDIDKVFRHAIRHHCKAYEFVPWRRGAGNDETVWEAPGYEVPFVEVSRSQDLFAPFREYHSSLDTPEILSEDQLDEFYRIFVRAVEILERNARLYRTFDGLPCLSNPEFDLYWERPDPAVDKHLGDDADRWGYLADSLLRYFDGSMTILDIAEKHDVSFDRMYRYLRKFREKGLVKFRFAPVERPPISTIGESCGPEGVERGMGSS